MAGIADNKEIARGMLSKAVESGAALKKFRDMVLAQGGDVAQIDDPKKLPLAKHMTELAAPDSGYICHMEAVRLGTLAMQIGAGRAAKDDKILPGTGIVLEAKVGDLVKKGQTLARIYHDKPLSGEWISDFYNSYRLTDQPSRRNPLIYKILGNV